MESKRQELRSSQSLERTRFAFRPTTDVTGRVRAYRPAILDVP